MMLRFLEFAIPLVLAVWVATRFYRWLVPPKRSKDEVARAEDDLRAAEDHLRAARVREEARRIEEAAERIENPPPAVSPEDRETPTEAPAPPDEKKKEA